MSTGTASSPLPPAAPSRRSLPAMVPLVALLVALLCCLLWGSSYPASQSI